MMKQLKYTWFEWNFVIAVNINSSFSNVLNPVLDITNSGIDTNTGTLNTIANHTNLGKSKLITILHKNQDCIVSSYQGVNLSFSCIIKGPPESPWQESLPLTPSPAQMWKLKNGEHNQYMS